jgi:predicted DNA-binding transcriptional regulator YafY
MRADRLLSLALLLQARGRMTAQELAQELEVSVRTIYRDVNALSSAGIPVYADLGPGGGYALLDGFRTELTGLTQAEVRALFMLSIPGALAELGLAQELQQALRKLSAALPADRQRDEAWVRQRIHLDWGPSPTAEAATPLLSALQKAVWEDRRLRITYNVSPSPYPQLVERVVDPYGLVAQTGSWHLVCQADGMRVYQVTRLLEARVTEETFTRPPGFDLAFFWSAWRAAQGELLPSYVVTLRCAPAVQAAPHLWLGTTVRLAETPRALVRDDAWATLSLAFPSLHDARARILALGGAVEVLKPEALRQSVLDYARQTMDAYGCLDRAT